MAKASKIFDKSYITSVNRNKTAPFNDPDRTQVITEWIKRGQELRNDRSSIFFNDSRLQKATTLLASGVVGDKYHIFVDMKDRLTVDDGMALLKFYHKKPRLVESLEHMLNSDRLSSYMLEYMASQEQDKGVKYVLENIKDSTRIQEKCNNYINSLMERTELNRKLYFGMFFAILFGDHIYEIVYDEEKEKTILDLCPLSLSNIIPRVSNKGIITLWEYSERHLSGSMADTLNPYQILRFMFMPDIEFGELIGRGLYDTTKLINMVAHRMERLTVVARETRAVQTRVHFPNYKNLPTEMLASLQIVNEDEILKYKEKIRNQMIQRGPSVEIFTNGLWDQKNIESDRADSDFIKDADYFDQLFKTGLLVPPGLIDNGERVNRATMDLQIKFLKGLLNSLKDMQAANMKQLFYTELILKDMPIDNIDLSVSYDNTGLIDTAEASQIVARLHNRFTAMPYPILTKYMGIEWKDFLRAVKQQEEAGITVASTQADDLVIDKKDGSSVTTNKEDA
jgi:hypothetical protein